MMRKIALSAAVSLLSQVVFTIGSVQAQVQPVATGQVQQVILVVNLKVQTDKNNNRRCLLRVGS